MIKQVFLFALVLLFSANTFSQTAFKEGNIWYFHDFAGLDFNAGSPPSVLNNGQLSGGDGEGCGTISDASGNLLFYTNGVEVYDRTHNLMPNGTGLNGHHSATQTGLIVPQPGSATIYYVFSVGDGGTLSSWYSIIDLSLNGGNGDVTTKNVLLENPTTEKLTAVHHANGTDIWIISHRANSNTFAVFQMTTAGLNTTPILSAVGSVLGSASNDIRGAMKVSSKGSKLVVCSGAGALYPQGLVEIFDFDKSTGLISNPLSMTGAQLDPNLGNPYGLEFSPDETKLYVSTLGANTMVQVDVSVWSIPTILASVYNYKPILGPVGTGQIQIGPDKKIYVALFQHGFVGVINNPNDPGASSNFVRDAINLGATCKYGLPNIIQSYFADASFTFTGTCPGDTTFFSITNPTNVIGTSWNFGDPPSGLNDTSTAMSPGHLFTGPGNYNVQVIVTYPTSSDTFNLVVPINWPSVNLGNDTTSCDSSITLNPQSINVSYLWSPTGDTTATINVNTSGTYIVNIEDNTGCKNVDTIVVTMHPPMALSIVPTNAGCLANGGSAALTVNGGTPNFGYAWSTGATTQNIANIAAGSYSVTVTDGNGCTANDSVSITENQTIVIDTSTVTNLSTCISNDGVIDITTSIFGIGNVDTLLSDGFETDGQITRYTANPYPGNPNNSFFFKRGDDLSINFTTNPINEEGTFYFGAKWTGFSSIPILCDVTFNPTNIATYTNLEMCALIALGRNNMGTAANTRITLEYNLDGLGWNTLMDFRKPAGNGLSEDTNGDGIGDGIALSTAFQDFCYPIPTTGNNIELRVTTNASGSSLRQTAFDYVRLKGIPPFTYSYLWSTGATTQDINNLAAGTYWVQITGSNGCIITDTFTVTSPCIVPVLQASFNLPVTTICEGESITFTDSSTGNNVFGWNWTFNGGTPASANTQGSHTITFNTPNTYNIVLQATDSSGTDDTTIVITVLPKANGTANTSICQGDSILLGGAFQNTAGVFSDTIFNGAFNGCDSIVSTTLTVTPAEDATFNYSLPSYCQTEPNQTPSINGTSGGAFTSSPGGLSLNGGTGDINFGASSPGTYGILYTTPGASCQDTLTVFVTITTTEDATFNYSNINYCQNDTNPTPNIIGTLGGVFTSSPAGLTINNGNGTINLSSSTPGTYGILYTTPSTSCQDTLTLFITINTSEDATFNYALPIYCQSEPDPNANITGTVGGIFTSFPIGLNINGSNGLIDLSTSTPGTYGVLYTTPGPNCIDTLTVFITVTTSEDATFNYPTSNFCQNDPDPIANITGTTGGAFNSSPAGLNINPTNGLIDVSASTPGTYGVIYTTPSVSCQDTMTVFVTIIQSDLAQFNYTASSYCFNDLNPIATITGTSGGTFTIDNGASINNTTGEIDITTSGIGNYTITYITNGFCPDSATILITIINNLDATITPTGPYCSNNAALNLVGANTGGTWSGTGITNTTNGTFDPNASGVGTHQIIYTISGNCGSADTVNITVFATPSIVLTVEDDNCFSEQGSIVAVVTGGASPYSYNWDNGENTPVITNLSSGGYILLVTDSVGCSASTFGSVEDLNNDCDFHIFLPNIFSPNGDEHNDVFIIRGEGIKSVSLIVYSRWGEKVFETSDVEIGWDGSFKGQPMNTAVFVYYLSATMINDEIIEKQGNVTLVR